MKKLILHIHLTEWYIIPTKNNNIAILSEIGIRAYSFLCFTIQIV